MKVSFIVPVSNSGIFLTEALNSISDNACNNIEVEILVIDDCSTDPYTIQLLPQIDGQSGVRVLRHERNGGPAKARNTGIRAATGDWIAFLDFDDLLALGTMELRYLAITTHPNGNHDAANRPSD